MPTAHKAISSAFVAVAEGPGQVIFSFNDDVGRFAVHNSTSPTGIPGGHRVLADTPYKLDLVTGEVLHLAGRGIATVSAATLV